MKVIIPAAGIGTRLRPHTHTTPKSLLNVAGKPILGHILDNVAKMDVSEVIPVVGFFGDRIRDYVTQNYNFKTRFVDQSELKGLGYAIHLTAEYLDDEPVLIILGDTIYEADLSEVITDNENAIGIREVDDPSRFGIAEMKDGYISRLVEKPENPKSNLAIVGIYYIKDTAQLVNALREIIDKKITTRGEYQLTDALQIMIRNGAGLKVFNVEGWYDCGKPETLLSTNRYLLGKLNSTPEIEGSVIIPPVYISPKADVRESIIGPNVSIADGAVVTKSIIKDTIIGRKSEVHQCVMDSSLIGDYAHVQMQFRKFNVGDSSEIGYS
ncbi:MAG: NTP transferase domain-containing protein [candidate division Zixibacteria bacterium]|nr:NTP transferase domain-containing protein [candidate division Zixibacteria bacterium]